MNNNQYLQNDDLEINLAELFHILLRRGWMIFIASLLGLAIMAGVTKFLITPKYESQAMIYILTKTTSVTSMVDLQIGSAITEDFEVIATSKPVIDAAIKQIEKEHQVTFTRKEISKMLTITNMEGTRILQIQVESKNPEHACWLANAVADATAERMADIMKTDPPTTVERAEVAEHPVSPSLLKNSIIGFLLGGILVCGVIIMRFILNDNIKTDEDVERYLGAPTLVMIPEVKARRDDKSKLRKQKGGTREKRA